MIAALLRLLTGERNDLLSATQAASLGRPSHLDAFEHNGRMYRWHHPRGVFRADA